MPPSVRAWWRSSTKMAISSRTWLSAANSRRHGASPSPRPLSANSRVICWSAISVTTTARSTPSTRRAGPFSARSRSPSGPATRRAGCGLSISEAVRSTARRIRSTSPMGLTAKRTGCSARSMLRNRPAWRSCCPPSPFSASAASGGGAGENTPAPLPRVRGRLHAAILRPAGAIEGPADDLARQGPGQFAALCGNAAIDDDGIDADGAAPDLHRAARKVANRLARLRCDPLRIEDRDVGGLAQGDKAAIDEIVHQRGPAGQPVYGLFERHDLLLAHPIAQQLRAVVLSIGRVRPRAAVAGADHGIARAENCALRLRIVIAVDADELGLQILVERQVEKRIDRALALRAGDFFDAFALEHPVALVIGHENLHQIPAPVEIAARPAAAVGAGTLLGDRAFDRLGAQRPADGRIAESLHALAIGPRHDRIPGRHPGEDAVRVHDVLVLRDVEPRAQVEDRPGDNRSARTVGARPAVEALLEPAQVLLPLLGSLDGLRNEVVDRRTPAPRRQCAGSAVRGRDPAGSAAADLEDAGAQFAEHAGERQALLVGGGAGRIAAVQRCRAETQRAGMHRLADQLLHRGQFLRRRLRALTGRLAHHIAADPRMADQGSDIDPAPPAESLHVFGNRFPIEFHPASQDPERDLLGVREEFEIPFLIARPHRRDDLAALADDHGGMTVQQRGAAIRIPQRLWIEMGVMIDKARRDDAPVGVDNLVGDPAELADRDDFALLDRNIRIKSRRSRAVDDAPVADQQIVGHGASSRISGPALCKAMPPASGTGNISPLCQAVPAAANAANAFDSLRHPPQCDSGNAAMQNRKCGNAGDGSGGLPALNGTCAPRAASRAGSGRRSRNGSAGPGLVACRHTCRAAAARTGWPRRSRSLRRHDTRSRRRRALGGSPRLRRAEAGRAYRS